MRSSTYQAHSYQLLATTCVWETTQMSQLMRETITRMHVAEQLGSSSTGGGGHTLGFSAAGASSPSVAAAAPSKYRSDFFFFFTGAASAAQQIFELVVVRGGELSGAGGGARGGKGQCKLVKDHHSMMILVLIGTTALTQARPREVTCSVSCFTVLGLLLLFLLLPLSRFYSLSTIFFLLDRQV